MNDRRQSSATPELADVFRSLQSLLLSLDDLESFLQRLTGLAAAVVDQGNVACGITLRREGAPYTVASSDERSALLDEPQYASDDGPCIQSLRTGETVWLLDLDREQRWPDFVRHARSSDLEWSLSLALPSEVDHGAAPLGALNIYGFSGASVPDTTQQHRYELFAAQAAGAVQLATNAIRATETQQHLESALRSRSLIDQALGILMAQQHCTAEEAFALLRRHSQHNNIKLRDLSANMIQRVTGKPPQPGAPFFDS